jgi:hypothetical protein
MHWTHGIWMGLLAAFVLDVAKALVKKFGVALPGVS